MDTIGKEKNILERIEERVLSGDSELLRLYNSLYVKLRNILKNNHIATADFETAFSDAISKGFYADYRPLEEFSTLLWTAIAWREKDKAEIINILLDAGANVNITDNENWNALMLAASTAGGFMSLERIIKNTKDINHKSKRNKTAFGILCRKYITGKWDEKMLLQNIKYMLMANANPVLDNDWTKNRLWSKWENERAQQLSEKIKIILEQIDNLKKSGAVFDYEL